MNLQHYFEKPQLRDIPHLISEEKTIAKKLVPFANGNINADVAIIGVLEDGNSLYNRGTASAPDMIRSYLYALKDSWSNLYLADLGNLKKGMGLNDTYFALQDIMVYLKQNQVIPIFIGGSHDLTFPVIKGLGEILPHINLAVADNTIDQQASVDVNDHSFLHHISSLDSIENISVMGLQGYQSDEEGELEIIRLKDLREDTAKAEPIFRDADYTSLDISVVKASDAPGCGYASPNGIMAEQFCKLGHYAGLSDRVSAFGLYGVNPTNDLSNTTAQLAAQCIWHFISGLDNRFKDYPLRDYKTYSKKIVHQEDLKREITFYHNIQNNRWWFNATEAGEAEIISCTLEDYLATSEGQLPERLMRFLR